MNDYIVGPEEHSVRSTAQEGMDHGLAPNFKFSN